jgi:phenylacetate-CoA ligase
MGKILGRSDDMIIFRAVNIYPGQIDSVLSTIDEIGSEYQIILGHGDDGRDYMTLRVESREGLEKVNHSEIEGKVSTLIKKSLLVSCNVEATSYGSLPRSERKSKRVFNNRMS